MEIKGTTLTGIQMVTLCLRLVALWLLVRAFQVAGVVFAIQNMVGEPFAKVWATETAALPSAGRLIVVTYLHARAGYAI